MSECGSETGQGGPAVGLLDGTGAWLGLAVCKATWRQEELRCASLGRLQDNGTVSWGPQEAQRLRVGATDPEVRGWGQWRGGRHSPHLAKRKTDQCVGRGGGVGGVEYIKNMLVSEHACSCGEDRKDSVVSDLKSSSFKPGGHSYLVQRKPRVCCPVEYKSPLASRTPILCILS